MTQMNINKLIDLILHGMPPPKPSYSLDGKKALMMANMAFNMLNQGEIKKAFDFMISSLLLGVPEPMNSRIKKILLDSLNRNMGNSINKRCNQCGTLNRNTNKYCQNCGRLL